MVPLLCFSFQSNVSFPDFLPYFQYNTSVTTLRSLLHSWSFIHGAPHTVQGEEGSPKIAVLLARVFQWCLGRQVARKLCFSICFLVDAVHD